MKGHLFDPRGDESLQLGIVVDLWWTARAMMPTVLCDREGIGFKAG
jgi:hypothetical protein